MSEADAALSISLLRSVGSLHSDKFGEMRSGQFWRGYKMGQVPEVNMEVFRRKLQRVHGSNIQAGSVGEDLTRQLLEQSDLSWFFVEQEKHTKAAQLSRSGGKRIDFVVGLDGAALLLDSKCMSPFQVETDGSLTFALTRTEIAALNATGSIFGLPVAVIFWPRDRQDECFVLDFVDRLTIEVQVVTEKGLEDGLAARFLAREIVQLEN